MRNLECIYVITFLCVNEWGLYRNVFKDLNAAEATAETLKGAPYYCEKVDIEKMYVI